MGHSLSHSYLPTINWLWIALHYHGQFYRGHLIVLNQINLFYYLGLNTIIGQVSPPILQAPWFFPESYVCGKQW